MQRTAEGVDHSCRTVLRVHQIAKKCVPSIGGILRLIAELMVCWYYPLVAKVSGIVETFDSTVTTDIIPDCSPTFAAGRDLHLLGVVKHDNWSGNRRGPYQIL